MRYFAVESHSRTLNYLEIRCKNVATDSCPEGEVSNARKEYARVTSQDHRWLDDSGVDFLMFDPQILPSFISRGGSKSSELIQRTSQCLSLVRKVNTEDLL